MIFGFFIFCFSPVRCALLCGRLLVVISSVYCCCIMSPLIHPMICLMLFLVWGIPNYRLAYCHHRGQYKFSSTMYQSLFISSHSSLVSWVSSLLFAVCSGFLNISSPIVCVIHCKPFSSHLLIEISWQSLGFLILYIPLIWFATSGEFVYIMISFYSKFSILHRIFCSPAASAIQSVTLIDPEHQRYPPVWCIIF